MDSLTGGSLAIWHIQPLLFLTILVSGEANFKIDRTGLTVGGFVQPGFARGLIEHPPNIEKGLCQRFLWILIQPCLLSSAASMKTFQLVLVRISIKFHI